MSRVVNGAFMIQEWPVFFPLKCEIAGAFFSWIMISLEAMNHDFP